MMTSLVNQKKTVNLLCATLVGSELGCLSYGQGFLIGYNIIKSHSHLVNGGRLTFPWLE